MKGENEMKMLLKDFVKSREIKQSTVSKYIRRHPETFEGHSGVEKNQRWIDETAYRVLDEVYQLPKMESIWTPESKRRYDDLLERHTKLQDVHRELQEELYQERLERKALDTTYREELLLEAGKMTAAAVEQVERELEEKHSEELKVLKNSHKERLEEIHEDYAGKMETLKSQHERELDKVKALYEAECNKTVWDKFKEKIFGKPSRTSPGQVLDESKERAEIDEK